MREFRGWVPERVTEHEYDADGRIVRSAQWVESAWDEQQRGWMLALDAYEADLCPHCGGPSSVCQSADADRNNPRATWIYWPISPAECAISTAMRVGKPQLDKLNPDGRRALIPRAVRVRRGAAKPSNAIV
ncbi:hypothetical protein [Salinispora arenicola]|uniref:hypothetical protein n=1 Tax=Salinispora arenicola TaxID=168697 RepID=UPI0016B2E9BE|nr:hypothetical protein [Salinispora arenicola]NIL57084.1 hypothetical protein [Salinispora arenicola]NIL62695.1 hypothetical protein [Salinispora arenicola]